MKIDTDLRLAIKAAERAQPRNDWQARHKSETEAIQALIAKPKYSTSIKKALADVKRGKAILERANEVITALGISRDLDRIYDGDKFRKAGGILKSKIEEWKSDEVMKELLAAPDKDRAKILLKYGINWK